MHEKIDYIISTLDKISLSDAIQLFGILCATIISLISIIISVVTLRQNSKMIKESVRPYITVSFDLFNCGIKIGYFVIKNYGQTQAVLNKFECCQELKEISQVGKNFEDFSKLLIGMPIAPGQKILLPIVFQNYKSDFASFDIEYSNGKNKYKEHFNIPVNYAQELYKLRAGTPSKENQIYYALQEIAERL